MSKISKTKIKLDWLPQESDKGHYWGLIFPQFYIIVDKKETTLTYIRGKKIQPRHFQCKSLHQAKYLANQLVKSDLRIK